MRKVSVIMMVLMIVGLFAFIDGAEAKKAQIIMKFGHVGAPDGVTHLAAVKFADAVKEKTGGKVKVDIYPSSQLGGPRDMIEGLEIGTTHIVAEPFTRLQVYAPIANVANLLFMIRDREHAEKVWNGPIGDEFFKMLAEKSGIMVVSNMWRGTRVITSAKPVYKLGDLKGLKIRVPPNPMVVALWKALGASPTPIEFNELFMALKQGVVDAQENPVILSYTKKFYEVCKHWSLTHHVKQVNSFLMNKDYFAGLDADVQKAIREAGLIAAKFHGDYVDDQIGNYIQKLKDNGVEIIEPKDMAAWQKRVEGLIDNYPDFKPWYEKIVAVK